MFRAQTVKEKTTINIKFNDITNIKNLLVKKIILNKKNIILTALGLFLLLCLIMNLYPFMGFIQSTVFVSIAYP